MTGVPLLSTVYIPPVTSTVFGMNGGQRKVLDPEAVEQALQTLGHEHNKFVGAVGPFLQWVQAVHPELPQQYEAAQQVAQRMEQT